MKKSPSTFSLSFCFFLTLCCLAAGNKLRVDLFPECEEWAQRGDCGTGGRPYFMYENCPESCHRHTHKPPETRRVPDDKEEFFELTAKDASGKVLHLENYEGYVTVVVNGARVCDYSEVFYSTLEHMHSMHPFTLEILAFPFEHPNITIDSCKDELLALEKQPGRKIHVMEPVKINGPDTHPVFKYLKELFSMENMDPNFAHYFFVNPDGNLIELHYGASYNALKSFVDRHVKEDLKVKKKWEL